MMFSRPNILPKLELGTFVQHTAPGKLAQIINEMKTSGLHILGLAEMRWPDAAIYHPTAVVRRMSKYELEKQQQYLVK